MKRRTTKSFLKLASIGLVSVLGAVLVPSQKAPAQSTSADSGVLCSNGPTYDLNAGLGYIFTPDANVVAMWSYSDNTVADSFQFPGPIMCVQAGTTVTVNLTNNLPEDTSIVFPGQSNVLANGVPSEPVINASTGAITSLAPVASANGGTVSYSFVASNPGTYLYTTGTNVEKQKEMGLYGAIIVRPSVSGQAYGLASTTDDFTPGREFIQILSEIDPFFHSAVDNGENPSLDDRVSKYFFINGRAMPDVISPNNSPFLPAQPYGGLVHVIEDQTALVRFVNAGRNSYPYHPHGADTIVIGRDGKSLTGQETADGGQDLSYNKFLIDVAPGQTVDSTYTWHDVESYSETNPVPVVIPQVRDLLVTGDTWYSMSPYLGKKNPDALPAGTRQTSECGEYYHMAHSHALEQATNFGAAFGGMMSLYRIDPAPSRNAGCPV